MAAAASTRSTATSIPCPCQTGGKLSGFPRVCEIKNTHQKLAGNLLETFCMISNSFFQRVVLTIFFGFCAAILVQGYKHIIWRANEDINGSGGLKALYGEVDNSPKPAKRR